MSSTPEIDSALTPEALPGESHVRRYACAAALLLVGVCVYLNSFNGVFVYDDLAAVLGNESIHQLWPPGRLLSAVPGSNLCGRPVGNVMMALCYATSGEDPFAYHLFNLTIHLANGLLIFGLVRRLLLLPRWRESYAAHATCLAFAVALLWLVHPLQTGAVTYISQRAESMVGTFYLLTMYGALRSWDTGLSVPGRRGWQALAVLACALGMGTKELMVTAPLMVVAFDAVFFSDSFWKTLRARLPFYVGLCATYGVLYACLQQGKALHGGIGGHVVYSTPLEYALTQFGVITRYLGMCFWPYPQALRYEYPLAETLGDVLPYLFFIGALVVGTFYGLYRRHPFGFVGLWFFLILAPTSSIMPLREVFVEHRMYLPLASVALLLVLGTWRFARLTAEKAPAFAAVQRGVVWSLLLAAAGLLATRSVVRNRIFEDELALWCHHLEITPGLPVAHIYIGRSLSLDEPHPAAIHHYRMALIGKPNNAQVHHFLGRLLVHYKRYDEALDHLLRAQHEMKYPEGYFNSIGLESLRLDDRDTAEDYFLAEVHFHSDNADAHENLGGLFMAKGDLDSALGHFALALEHNPRSREAHLNIGWAWARLGELDKALIHFHAALAIDPQYKAVQDAARRALGAAQEKAVAGHFDDAKQLRTLATALALNGDFDRAERMATRGEQLARQAGETGLAEVLAQQIAAFKQGRVYPTGEVLTPRTE